MEIFVEVYDKGTGSHVPIPTLDALKSASNINAQLIHALEGLFKQAQDGTVPEFERRSSE